jgi:hypothetical protein
VANYEHYKISVASEFFPENLLYTAIVVGNPLTGDWALEFIVDHDLLPELVGEGNAAKVVALLADLQMIVESKSATDSNIPAAELFGNQWLTNLLRQSGEIFQLSQFISISGLNADQVLMKAVKLHDEQLSAGDDSHNCEDHTHSVMPPHLHKLSDEEDGDHYPIKENEGTSAKELLHEVAHISFALGDLADNILKAIFDPMIDRLHEEAKSKAMRNPKYAEIEKRRRPEGQNPHSAILYSEEHNLGPKEFEFQRKVYKSVARSPWWGTLAHKLANEPVSRIMHGVQHIGQRVIRGWDDSDVWQLDTALAKRLGEQLIALSHNGKSWPGSGEDGEGEYKTEEDWEIALHIHGSALLDYSLYKYEFEPRLDGTRGPLEELYEAAQDSLVWVAENLGDLWD